MKYLRLSAWLLAPAAMILLGYLFLLPPETPDTVWPGPIAIVILDPIDPSIIETIPDTASLLAHIRQHSISGPLACGYAASVEDAVREILTGTPVNKLRNATVHLDRDTVTLNTPSPWNRPGDTGLAAILPRCNRTVRLLADVGPAADDHPDLPATPVTGLPDLSICYIPRSALSDRDYLREIDSTLAPIAGTIDTWIVVCPFHYTPVTWRFHLNRWLAQHPVPAGGDSTAMTPPSASDPPVFERSAPASDSLFASRNAFFVGDAVEPGVRINRDITFRSGTVRREDYERFRKDLAAALRTVTIPEEDNDSDDVRPERPLFAKLFRGEQIFSGRSEGSFPDLVWEPGDESVEIVASMPADPDASPWQRVRQPGAVSRPGGWCAFSGPAFLARVESADALEGVTTADIAPTVLFLISCAVPRDMPGRVLQPLMKDAMQVRVPAYVDSYSWHDPLVQQEF